MRNRPLTPVGRALVLACLALAVVLLAFVGLARLATDAPAPSARAAAPAAELVAGQVDFDSAAVAAERRRDVVGALLTFCLFAAAVCTVAFAISAGVLALRGTPRAEANLGEEAFGPVPGPR
jgi:hypothetical protein